MLAMIHLLIEESVARYLQQLDTADRQEPSEAPKTKTSRLKEKIAKLKEEMQRLRALEARSLHRTKISLTDPDARSSTRDIEAAFTDADGRRLVSRAAVSEITERLWEEYEVFTRPDLTRVPSSFSSFVLRNRSCHGTIQYIRYQNRGPDGRNRKRCTGDLRFGAAV
jgi:hypothetical protein